jgi:hypothetical protein
MAFDGYLPRNAESRAISQSIRLIKRHAPHVKWIISYADACSCGDGAIYRASNFVLTGIKQNEGLFLLPDGSVIHKLTLESQPKRPRPELGGRSFFDVTDGKFSMKKYVQAAGAVLLPGWQLRYIYFIDKTMQQHLTVPIIPFSRIDELDAGMYRGEKIAVADRKVVS